MKAKIFQKAGFALESGLASASPPGWGDTVTTLGAGDAIPYLSVGKAKKVNFAQDNSITSIGYAEVPRKVSSYVEQGLSFLNKFYGLNPLLFWSFGLEDEVQDVVCYVCNTVTTDPEPGDTYTDAQSHVCTFLRKEVNKSSTFYIFAQSAAPTLSTGTLTRTSGSGDSTITFTARSALMYEHVFKLDPRTRHQEDVPTDEQLSFYASGDKKSRMALIGVNVDTDMDILNVNAMCKKFSISSAAGDMTKIDTEFVARDQSIDDHDSDTWTYPSGMTDSDGNVMHHDWMVQVGEYDDLVSALSTVGVTSFSLNIDIPLQMEQDTVSGQYLMEPVMQGKYGIDMNIVLSRYASTIWQQMTDNWTGAKARLSAVQGYYMQELLINYCVINSPGPNEDDVSKEDLSLIISDYETDNWEDYLYGCVLAHGPVTMRVRNTTSINQMET